jgi:hypothetical protein
METNKNKNLGGINMPKIARYKIIYSFIFVTVLTILTIVLINSNNVNAANKVAIDASQLIENKKIEKIITTIHKRNEKTIYIRDKENLKESVSTYDLDGKLINQIIVKENGSQVISVGIELGNMVAYTWKLPDKIVEENQKNLKKSLLTELKVKLEKANWSSDGFNQLEGKTYKILIKESGYQKETLFIDTVSGYPKKLEIFDVKSGEMISTEEYEFADSIDDSMFVEPVKAQEVEAPVVENSIGEIG